MRRRFTALALALALPGVGCTTLDHMPSENFMDRADGTVVTDAELKARGEWEQDDATARCLLGPRRGQVRLASQARASTCDVIRVGPYELLLPNLSTTLGRITGQIYEPRYYRTRTAWVLLRRDRAPIIIRDKDGRPAPDDAPSEVFQALGRQMKDQADALSVLTSSPTHP